MDKTTREKFYDLRHQLDKQKDYDLKAGELALQPYWSLLPPLKGLTVLDAGAGTGWASQAFAAQAPAMLYGIDISPRRIAELAAAFQAVEVPHHFEAGSVERLDFIDDGSLDFIHCRDVIEHVEQPGAALAEFRRTLKPGALLLLQTPNDLVHGALKLGHHSFMLIEALASEKTQAWQPDDPFLMQESRRLDEEGRKVAEAAREEGIHEHERLWRPADFVALLEKAGFVCEKLAGTPLFSSTFFQLGRALPSLSALYCEWLAGENHRRLAEALAGDLLALGRIDAATRALPADYVISDDLIVLARKAW